MLGTCLPTAESLARGDRHADMIDRQRRAVGAALPGCTLRVVKGEYRYYESDTRYALISRALDAIWFEVRADGDYRAKR